jgi:hypothetical protein
MQPERLVAGGRLEQIVGSMQPDRLVDGCQMLGDWAASLVGIPEWLAINSMQPERLVAGERVGLLLGSPLPGGLVDGERLGLIVGLLLSEGLVGDSSASWVRCYRSDSSTAKCSETGLAVTSGFLKG